MNQDTFREQEFEPVTKPVKASLLDNPYLLGVALVSLALRLSAFAIVMEETVCITWRLPLWL